MRAGRALPTEDEAQVDVAPHIPRVKAVDGAHRDVATQAPSAPRRSCVARGTRCSMRAPSEALAAIAAHQPDV